VRTTRRMLITLLLPLLLLVGVGAMTVDADIAPAFIQVWTADGDANGDWFAYAVGTAGDVNGDGYADVIVGAPNDMYEIYREGVVYVYHGSAGGLTKSNLGADWIASSDQKGANFGAAVSTAGDVNGDGYDDVIVGAKDYQNPSTTQGTHGAAFVFYGSPTGLALTPGWSLIGEQQNSNLGVAVSTAGDVNNDGYADVIVGANRYSNGQTSEGLVQVFFGATDGLTTTPGWTFESNQAYTFLGEAVASAGDINGNGYDDIIVGAPGYNGAGAAYIFYGAADGISTTHTILYGAQSGARFGAAVSGAGDVNGDGYADILVGAPVYSSTYRSEGTVFVYLGSPSGVITTPQRMLVGGSAWAKFGAAVGSAGDLDGDGYAEIVVGAPGYTDDQPAEGAVFLYLGTPAGVGANPIWRSEGNKSETLYGLSVGTAGDVNGDGHVDLIVGAPDYKTQGENKRGRAFVYHGTGNTGGYFAVYLPFVLRSNF